MDIRTKISILFGIVVGGTYLIVSMNRMNDKIQLPEYDFTGDIEKTTKLLSELETKKEELDGALDSYNRMSTQLRDFTYGRISFQDRVNSWIQVSAISIPLITAVLLIYFQRRKANRTLKVQTFLALAKRYNELVFSLPKEEMYDKHFNLDDQTKENKAKILEYAHIYFDLCFEAYHLRKEKLLDSESWTTLELSMKLTLLKPALNQSWYKISEEQMYNEDFKRFIKNLISS